MLSKNTCTDTRKRTLTKVRTQFLNRKDEPEEPAEVNSDTRYLCTNNVSPLNPALGLVEINRKINMGPQNLSLYFKVSDFLIENRSSSRLTRLSFTMDKNSAPLPWDYTLKRLESYGDLELATLAHRLDKFHKVAFQIVSKYDESLRNATVEKNIWEETKAKARKACEEIENSPIFYEIRFHVTKDSYHMVSNTYSEGLLKEMGYKPETFVEWTKKNGMPTMFGTDSTVFLAAIKSFLDFAVFSGNVIYMSPKYETFIYNSQDVSKKMMVQAIGVLEPIPDGFLTHYYFVGKNIASENPKQNKRLQII